MSNLYFNAVIIFIFVASITGIALAAATISPIGVGHSNTFGLPNYRLDHDIYSFRVGAWLYFPWPWSSQRVELWPLYLFALSLTLALNNTEVCGSQAAAFCFDIKVLTWICFQMSQDCCNPPWSWPILNHQWPKCWFVWVLSSHIYCQKWPKITRCHYTEADMV